MSKAREIHNLFRRRSGFNPCQLKYTGRGSQVNTSANSALLPPYPGKEAAVEQENCSLDAQNHALFGANIDSGLLLPTTLSNIGISSVNGVEIQCQGSAPTISVDNTAGCQLYLSKDSLEVSITTAKSSEINVLVPSAEPGGDWGEHSLPQQFVHVYKDGQFVTTPVSHSGG